MRIVDLNLLLYAVNADSPHHAAARACLEELLSGGDLTGFPWVVLLGFLRITTHPRIMPRPLAVPQALEIVDGWLARPASRIVHPSESHWAILRGLLADTGTAANLTTDAHLAALAIANNCELVSTDRDFGRFKHLRWRNPLD
jgi:uncharacterized protein